MNRFTLMCDNPYTTCIRAERELNKLMGEVDKLRQVKDRLLEENTRLQAISNNQCDDCACEIANERDRLKAENDELFYKLSGVMLSVDKWLDGEELNQDEVNRACTMREKTLQITERLKAERDKAVGVL